MIIEAKLKGDKDARQFSFTGHAENTEEGVRKLFNQTHPGAEFIKIVDPGLNRLTGNKLEVKDAPTTITDAPKDGEKQ